MAQATTPKITKTASAGGLGELSTEVAGMAVDENLDR